MKRFYAEAGVAEAGGGWQVVLDGRAIRTAGGRTQIVPSRALAEAMAGEWSRQGEEIDPAAFAMRDMADFAIDIAATDRAGTEASLLRFAETDTLCYRADPEDALHARQIAVWEPLLTAAERRWEIRFRRICGVIHRPQPAATLARLAAVVAAQDHFTLAALRTLAGLATSLVAALAAIEPESDAEALWSATNLEEDWQAELWGHEAEAAELRARRFATFAGAMEFARLAGTAD